MIRRLSVGAALVLALAAPGCQPSAHEPVLPSPDSIASFFGAGTDVQLQGNVLEIRGRIDPAFLRRGGRIWARSGPYFYLFNVKVRDALKAYPDLAAVRAIAFGPQGRELARATVQRADLTEIEWEHGLKLASRAQTEGTENPRYIEDLIHWGEDHTEHAYAGKR